MEALLEIEGLQVEYKTGRATANALNGIDLSIKKGEALGLVGETGAGKTTIALSSLNLLPKDVGKITAGSIKFEGQSILDMSEKKLEEMRGNKISMIFQNPLSSLNPLFTVGEQIAMVIRRHEKLNKKETRDKAAKLLETVGIAKYRLDDYPHQFSGGMRQRVGIAAALACNPELLIADEPTTALDVTIQAQILELMKDLQRKRSSSLLMITHNLGIIAELCQNVAVIYAGTIIEYGSVAEVFTNPQHWYTKGLLGAIPNLSGPRNRLSFIPGNVANANDLPKGCKFHPRCQHCLQKCRTHMPQMHEYSAGHMVACWEREGDSDGESRTTDY